MSPTARTLDQSRWASVPQRPRVKITNETITVQTSTEKVSRLLRRIEWKRALLLHSASLVIDTLSATHDVHQYARSMFKLDFFEFYSLLERYVVLCLQLCGVTVSRGDAPQPDGARMESMIGTHRFHANVLSTLDCEDCVLHESLGTGETRRYLGLAKEYRNRWKDADEIEEAVEDRRNRLEDLHLQDMLNHIWQGLNNAKSVVDRECTSITKNSTGHSNETKPLSSGGMEIDEAPFETVDDAIEMEWEL